MHHYQSLGGWTFAFKAYWDMNITSYATDPVTAAMAEHIDPYSWVFTVLNLKLNKKVLLRERKRHTDRGVSSTLSVSRGGVSPLAGVPPSQVWWRGGIWHGVRPGRGTPGPGLMGEGVPEVGYPPAQVWQGYPRWGTPLAGVPQDRFDRVPEVGYPSRGTPWWGIPGQVWWGYPRWGTPQQGYPPGWTWLDLAGVPPPPPWWTWPGYPPAGVDWQTKWNYNLPSRTTYAVGN